MSKFKEKRFELAQLQQIVQKEISHLLSTQKELKGAFEDLENGLYSKDEQQRQAFKVRIATKHDSLNDLIKQKRQEQQDIVDQINIVDLELLLE
jgi:hypothetical protein